MKGHKFFITAITTTAILSGCANTQSEIISENNSVIKYESRCGKHEYTKEENLADSINDMLLSTKAPRYPIKAARNGIQGYTKLEFDVSADGKPININVIEAYPSGIFNSAAIESFSGWRYKPKASSCHSIQLDFKMG
ncbi:energy transducer TonB [Shewanella sp. SP1S1-7]|uniref:energy transducer TonB n=1 Tax=Shewanella sp. SP1S1-7 TaxID=3063536 RepID=UPI0028901FFF|nr:energy transducer TonB [Shewanella sp. SP1S1-7]MDT3337929.1 energy transducer TonB [Shewanella sp. SP1S1-7]